MLGIDCLGKYTLQCSEIFEDHNTTGSHLLEITKKTITKLNLDLHQNEIILNGIGILKVKSEAKRALDEAMHEVVLNGSISDEL